MNTHQKSMQRGSTLLDLLIGLACLSALYSYAFTHGTLWLNERHAIQYRLELIQLIEHARLKSLLGSYSLTLCGLSETLSCQADWSKGVLLTPFSAASIAPSERDSERYVLKLNPALHLHGPRHFLEFFPDPEANVLNATFLICTPHGVGFPLVVNRVGRIRLPLPESNELCRQ